MRQYSFIYTYELLKTHLERVVCNATTCKFLMVYLKTLEPYNAFLTEEKLQ